MKGQIINATTLLLHSIFLDTWWTKQSAANTGCIVQLLAFSTFTGTFALVVAASLLIKRLIRRVSPMAKIAMDGLVATLCVADGSVSRPLPPSVRSHRSANGD